MNDGAVWSVLHNTGGRLASRGAGMMDVTACPQSPFDSMLAQRVEWARRFHLVGGRLGVCGVLRLSSATLGSKPAMRPHLLQEYRLIQP